MRKKHELSTITSIGISTLLLLLHVSPASALTLLHTVDDFETGGFSLSFPDGGNATGVLNHELAPDNQVFGERRFVTWDVAANPASREATASVVSGGGLSVLFVSTESGVEAAATLEYGDAGGGILGNLEQSAANAFLVVFSSLNQELDVIFQVTDGGGNIYSSSSRVGSSGQHVLPFEDFAGYDPGDFSSVPHLAVTFESPTDAPDYLLDGIFTSRIDPVPEPSTALLGGIAATLMMFRRRRS